VKHFHETSRPAQILQKARTSRDHRKLDAFKLADEMAVRIYSVTRQISRGEMYGLQSQLRRAAVSVPANIVEGCARESRRDYARFLEVAFSSTREVIYLLDLASRLEMVDKLKAEESKLFAGRVAAALAALIKVNRPRPHGTPSSPHAP